MRLLILTRYANLGASSRLRSYQYLPWFEKNNISYTIQPFFNDAALQYFYQNKKYSKTSLIKAYAKRLYALIHSKHYDLIWIEKEALPWLPTWLEALLLKNTPYVMDFDDAIFHNYDQHRLPLVRHLYGKRIDKLMSKATLISAGNPYLAQRAMQARAPQVEIIPTVIDINRYTVKTQYAKTDEPLRIVWIGSPHTLRYLMLIHQPLITLSQRFNLTLTIIAGSPLELSGVNVEFIPWTEANEVESIKQGDIGIMPLEDAPWERGKCGYKMIQYMACGLPVVASPVGVNCDIIKTNENGYLAANDQEWIDTLSRLLSDQFLRQRLGKAGRQLVEHEYCIQQVAPRLIKLLQNINSKELPSCAA